MDFFYKKIYFLFSFIRFVACFTCFYLHYILSLLILNAFIKIFFNTVYLTRNIFLLSFPTVPNTIFITGPFRWGGEMSNPLISINRLAKSSTISTSTSSLYNKYFFETALILNNSSTDATNLLKYLTHYRYIY